jgi:HAD superfamily hydrolase (TIGR01509 family)
MTIKAILFDHDGTLVDSEGCHFDHWVKVFREFSIEFLVEDFKAFYTGIPSRTSALDMVNRYRLNITGETLMLKKIEVTSDYLSGNAFPLMPNAMESVKRLFNLGFTLGMVTGANSPSMNRTLGFYQLKQIFKVAVSADDVEKSKPEPECYLLAAKQLGLNCQECLAIEDTEHGVESATRSGMSCIAIPNEFSQSHDFSKATLILPNLKAASDWIELNYSPSETGRV